MKRMMTLFRCPGISLLAIWFLLSPASIHSSPENRDLTELFQENLHERSDFYLRIIYSPGTLEGHLTHTSGEVETLKGGISLYSSLQVGYTLIDNLILFGEFSVVASGAPAAYINGTYLSKEIARYAIPSLSLGATWYFMPLNLYVSSQLRLPELHYHLPHIDTYVSGWGLGFGATVGFDWPFDRKWSVGAALQFIYDMPGLFLPDRYTFRENIFVGFSLTATYN